MNLLKVLHHSTSLDRLSFTANFSWALVGNTIFSFSQWGILVILAKLGSPELVGLFALANAVTAPIFMFVELDLTSVQSTDVQNSHRFGDYLGLRIVLSLLGMIFVIVITQLGGYGESIAVITILVGLTRVIESISGTTYGLLTKQERLDLVARSQIIRGIAPLAAIIAAFYLVDRLDVAIFTQLLIWTITLMIYDLPNARRWQAIRPRFSIRILLSIFWVALPLGLVSGLNSFGTQVPRYAIEHFASTRELGIFSAIVSLGVIVSLFTTALSRAALPRFSYWYAQQSFDRFIYLLLRLTGVGLLIGAIGVLGATLFGKIVLTLVYTNEYAAYVDILILVMAGVGITATFTFVGTALTATRRFALMPPIHIGKILIIGIACFVLIPGYGISGAALATVIGSFFSGSVFSLMLFLILRKAKYSQVRKVQNDSVL